MEKSKFYDMTESQIKSGVRKALLNATTLAAYSKDIVERGGNEVLALGLFSFAIEEFGKSALLSECLIKKQKMYRVPIQFFTGKKSHDIKFEKALSTLPKECTNFEAGIIRLTSENETKTLDVGSKEEIVSIPKGLTGVFSAGDLPIDFETRMNCFYLDWDHQKNKWRSPPKVLPEPLEKAIIYFETHLAEKLDVEYDIKRS